MYHWYDSRVVNYEHRVCILRLATVANPSQMLFDGESTIFDWNLSVTLGSTHDVSSLLFPSFLLCIGESCEGLAQNRRKMMLLLGFGSV